MEKTVMISMPMEEFQSVIIECVITCLQNHKPPQAATPPSDLDQLLSIKDAADLLRLSVPTLYGYVHRSEIPVSKRGNRLYFIKGDLLAWVKQGRKQTSTETESSTNEFLTSIKRG